MSQESRREILSFLILGLAAFVGICLYTHDPEDFLGRDPGEPIANACGRAGAAIGHTMVLWLGKAGSYGLTVIIALFGLCLFFRRRIEQWGWKVLGALLLVLTLASFEVAVFDLTGSAEFYPGGHYGTIIYGALLSNLSIVGTYLILLFATLVAFVISTDTVLYPAVVRSREVLLDRERWGSMAQFLRRHTPSIPTVGAVRERVARLLPRRGKATRTSSRALKPTSPATATSGATGKDRTVAQRKADREDPLERRISASRASGDVVDDDVVDDDVDDFDDAIGSVATTKSRVTARGVISASEQCYDEETDSPDGDEDLGDEDLGDEDLGDEDFATDEDEDDDSARESTTRNNPRPSGEFKIHEPALLSRPKSRSPAPKPIGPYNLPEIDLIEAAPLPTDFVDKHSLTKTANKIETTLANFKIDAQVVEVTKGPTVTQFELSLAAGIKVHKIMNLADDLAMALKAPSIRIIAPIPGKSTVGLEVPNETRSMVGVRELVEIMRDSPKRYSLPIALGRDTAGHAVIGDLGEMPHLLIAGSTGSGKSVCINSIIISFLMTKSPDDVKLILLDPKMVELAQFEKIPHLLSPVVTDMKKAPAVLNWLVDKMDERYELLALAGVRQISSYNELGRERLHERLRGKIGDDEIAQIPEKLPFVVVVIDELADLMMTAAKEVEGSITRLSQKSRAVGIHVILATQRPSVDVITGLIKANMPSRISFRVTSRVDSRTILDRNGADKLLGKGDCLFLPPGSSDIVRVQGAFISDREIRDVVQCAAQEAEPQYNDELTRFGIEAALDGSEADELFDDAVVIVLGSQRGSVTLLQRQLQIGYTRASRLMELMHDRGLVGPFQGSKAREVYYTLEEWEKSRGKKANEDSIEDEAE